MTTQGSETINLDTLDVQQLSQVKKQLEEELEHLTTSFAQLHSAQAKFRECLRCVKARLGTHEGDTSVLVPLTNSLYVRGELADPKHVIVDVGTGFYVEKDTQSAQRFYEAKVQQLQNNIQDLETIVQRKTSNVRSVEDVLRQKVLQSQAA
ncbi:byr1-binding protein bob1 [Colletotrichum musicola]|uniref:Byr1-binding protein bob1 n=1 Tax=Colletotrichum musicola TaxID=2175873 RepID=A0A8H6J962_9PEZI|nr:byr1-binding protein bob1 [Colletotrichum musicola]